MNKFNVFVLFLSVSLIQQTASSALIVNATFNDVVNNTGVGFDDAAEGLARRNTVQAVFNYISSQLDPTVYNTAVDYTFNNSQTDGSGSLASSGPFFFTGPPGFYNGFVYDHATTGIDPTGAVPDGVATFDFGYNWYAGTAINPGGVYDLFSVVLHEVTHAMGFLAAIDAAGLAPLSNPDANPGVFTVFDTFLELGDGTQLFSAGGNYDGTAGDLVSNDIFFDGPNATAANGGNPVKIFAPGAFSNGSSISHFDPSLSLSVMDPGIAAGEVKRAWTGIDQGVLEDIGWVFAEASAVPEPQSIVLLGLAIMIVGCWRFRKKSVSAPVHHA